VIHAMNTDLVVIPGVMTSSLHLGNKLSRISLNNYILNDSSQGTMF
jgi:hypothetical protein